MRGAFNKSNLSVFVGGLMGNKGGYIKFAGDIKINKVKEWDGKDAKPKTSDDL